MAHLANSAEPDWLNPNLNYFHQVLHGANQDREQQVRDVAFAALSELVDADTWARAVAIGLSYQDQQQVA